jgi:hypothetical protein
LNAKEGEIMKCKYVLILIAVVLLSANITPAQEKTVVPDSTLLKKYEAIKESINNQAVQLHAAKARYLGEYHEKNDKLVTAYNTIDALSKEEGKRLDALKQKKELKPQTNKKEVK